MAVQLAETLCFTNRRINRRQLLVRLLALLGCFTLMMAVIAWATGQTTANPPRLALWLARLEVILYLLGSGGLLIVAIIQRLHDCNRSGWLWPLWLVLLPIPLLMPGTAATNQYTRLAPLSRQQE